METISIIVPAYNEQNSVAKTVDSIKQALLKAKKTAEIIFVNDGSTDKTGQMLKKFKDIKIITHKVNKGYGASLKSGIKSATGEWIVITDCDQTYPIEDLHKLVEGTEEGYDMVVGARTGKTVNMPLLRRPAKAILRFLVNYLSGQKIPDFNSGFRIFRKDMAMRFFSLYPDGFSFTTTITMAAMTNGYDVKFIPISYFKREGKSSIKARDFINFLSLIVRLTMYFKPLSVFAPVSILLFATGLIKIIIDFIGTEHFGIGGSVLLIAGVQLMLLGLVADIIIKRTNL